MLHQVSPRLTGQVLRIHFPIRMPVHQLVPGRAGSTVGSSTRSRQLGEDEQECSAAYLPGARPMPHRLRNRPLLPCIVHPTEPKAGHRPCGFSLLPELLTACGIPVLHSFVSSLRPAPRCSKPVQVPSHFMPTTPR